MKIFKYVFLSIFILFFSVSGFAKSSKGISFDDFSKKLSKAIYGTEKKAFFVKDAIGGMVQEVDVYYKGKKQRTKRVLLKDLKTLNKRQVASVVSVFYSLKENPYFFRTARAVLKSRKDTMMLMHRFISKDEWNTMKKTFQKSLPALLKKLSPRDQLLSKFANGIRIKLSMDFGIPVLSKEIAPKRNLTQLKAVCDLYDCLYIRMEASDVVSMKRIQDLVNGLNFILTQLIKNFPKDINIDQKRWKKIYQGLNSGIKEMKYLRKKFINGHLNKKEKAAIAKRFRKDFNGFSHFFKNTRDAIDPLLRQAMKKGL